MTRIRRITEGVAALIAMAIITPIALCWALMLDEGGDEGQTGWDDEEGFR